ncbi:hypothetical protein ACC730_37835, partial [Rhizobium ruizarguesonis]
ASRTARSAQSALRLRSSASHIAAMAPGTNLGAATTIALGGRPYDGERNDSPDTTGKQRQVPRDAGEAKEINDAVAYIRGLAEL